MRISNDESTGDSGWTELVRLQSEYQSRLAEETLRYLRGVQAAFSPRAPGTVVQATGARLRVVGAPSGHVDVEVSVENRQRVYTTVAPAITSMTNDDGWTWYPKAEARPVAMLLAPDEVAAVSIRVQLPTELSPGVFRGSLILQGFVREPIPLEIVVEEEHRPVDTGGEEQP